MHCSGSGPQVAAGVFLIALQSRYKAINSLGQCCHYRFFLGGFWNKFFIWVEDVISSGLERLADFLAEALAGFAQFFESIGSDLADDLADFETESSVHFFQCGPATHHKIPRCNSESARHGGDSQVDGAFTAQQFFAPARQRSSGAPKDRVGSLNQQAAEVLASVATDAAAPLALSAVIESGIQADVLDQLLGMSESLDVSNNGSQRKGDHLPDPAKPYDRQEQWIGQHLLSDQSAPVFALLLRMLQLHQESLDELPLAWQPVVNFADFLRYFRLGQPRTFPEPHTVIAQIGLQPVAQLSGALNRLAMDVKKIAPLLGFEVRDPNDSCRPGQVGFGDSYGADLVVVGVSFLEFAQVAALHDHRLALNLRQNPNDVEAVTGSFQHQQVLRGGVLLRPSAQMVHGQFVEDLLHYGRRRRWPAHDRRGEGIWVRVKTNHPLDFIGFCVHICLNGYAGGRKRVRRLHALRYSGRSPCRCFAPVLIR
jgi:hypothetical protein